MGDRARGPRAVIIGDDLVPTGLADGDVVVRRVPSGVRIGLVAGGEPRWLGEAVPASELPSSARRDDEALLRAARRMLRSLTPAAG